MKFLKDLLFIDVQTTGSDPDKDVVIQIAASLVDRDNFLEKQHFNTYVRISLLDSTLSKYAENIGVDYDVLRKSPKLPEALKLLQDTFGQEVFLVTFSSLYQSYLRNSFKKASIPYPFDHHILDLWTLSYIYTLHLGFKKVPSIHTLAEIFNLKLKNQFDAMERVKVQSEIFGKIIKAL